MYKPTSNIILTIGNILMIFQIIFPPLHYLVCISLHFFGISLSTKKHFSTKNAGQINDRSPNGCSYKCQFFLPRIALDELLYFTVDEIDYVWTKKSVLDIF